ncbi:MAG: CoA transferase [Planctomycetota bacterium]|nr:CoA transferase [Planctomycetota bacterium]
MHPRPLSGLRVLDLTRVLAGPYCTLLLADLGAEVVKVERPGTGDDARAFGPFLDNGQSAYFASINRGKKSIALDLKDETDRATFLQLVAKADILVENYRAGTMLKLGLDAKNLRQQNPRLIYASLSGFGQTGSDTDRAAYDIVVQALSGLMSITGSGPGQSVRVGTSISDILTGIFGAVAIVSAVHGRTASGEGTVIDLAMLDCTVAALENAISRFATSGVAPSPLGTRHPSITPFQSFSTADVPIVIAAGNDALWIALCGCLDREDLATDKRFASNLDRTTHHEELAAELAQAFAQRPASEWLQRLSKSGIPSAPIRSIADVVADPHLASREMWHTMDDGQGGELLTAGSPFRMNDTAPPRSSTTPDLDEHHQEILSQWLMTDSP